METPKITIMKKILSLSLLSAAAVLFSGSLNAQAKLFPEIEGRWDLTIHNMEGKELPSWLEVNHSGNRTLVGRFVYAFGSARPVAKVQYDKASGKFHFSIPPQWERGDHDMEFEGTLSGRQLSGSMIYSDGKTYSWSGVAAPSLQREQAPVWGSPIKLFNGRDLTGWHAMGEKNQWVVEKGVLKSPRSGSNIATDKTFTDFKLHVEFRYPKESNSGVYLRGRYEVQIEDSKGMDPLPDLFSAIYGFITPNEMAAKEAGEWQSYDITLIGRRVTVIANGRTVICDAPIPGITGGAIDSKEGEPGPIFFQGDHGPVEFRNIIITPAK